MEQVTPQMLFGALVVLVIVALSLIVFLVRTFRKNRSPDQPPDELESLAMVQGASQMICTGKLRPEQRWKESH